MNKFVALTLSAVMALTIATQAPTQAHAASKAANFAAGVAVGVVAVAAIAAAKMHSQSGHRAKKNRNFHADDCGPGYRMKRGNCVPRHASFGGQKNFGQKHFGQKKFSKKRPAWQIQAIRMGCQPGLAWNKFEGCHEND